MSKESEVINYNDRIWSFCLDAVCKLLQSFGSDCLHGGNKGGQLVLGACSCSLHTERHTIDQTTTTALLCYKVVQLKPAALSRTRTYSSSGAWGWGKLWGRLSSRDAWWPGELQTQCCLPPAWGCPGPPVDRWKKKREGKTGRHQGLEVPKSNTLGFSLLSVWRKLAYSQISFCTAYLKYSRKTNWAYLKKK